MSSAWPLCPGSSVEDMTFLGQPIIVHRLAVPAFELVELRALRTQYGAALAHDELGPTPTGAYTCFRGDTLALTFDGPVPLGDLAGTTARLLTPKGPGRAKGGPGRWVDAEVRSFGRQEVMRLVVENRRRTKELCPTPEHRWFVRRKGPWREAMTSELRPGDRLVSLRPQSVASRTRPSPFGVAHGATFGDGALLNGRARLPLFGAKDMALLPYFPVPRLSTSDPRVSPPGVVIEDLPRFFKAPPSLDETTSYLYGWLAGYFAADGRVSRQGAVELYSADVDALEFAELVALRLGIGTLGISGQKRQGYGDRPSMLFCLRFLARTLDADFFVIPSHRERFEALALRHGPADWKVVSVETTGKTEEVFCAVVPGTEAFTLEGNILTGNCRNRRPYPETPVTWDRHSEHAHAVAADIDYDSNPLRTDGVLQSNFDRFGYEDGCDWLECWLEPPEGLGVLFRWGGGWTTDAGQAAVNLRHNGERIRSGTVDAMHFELALTPAECKTYDWRGAIAKEEAVNKQIEQAVTFVEELREQLKPGREEATPSGAAQRVARAVKRVESEERASSGGA